MANWKRNIEKILPTKVFENFVMPVRIGSVRLIRKTFELFGYNIVRTNDYYSPLPVLRELKTNFDRWNKPSSLLGINYDLVTQQELLKNLTDQYYDELLNLPSYKNEVTQDFGPGYSEIDALTLYAMIRHFKPMRYIEVGSGVSTFYSQLAGLKNAGSGCKMDITCIEPFPYKALQKIPNIHIISKQVQDIPLSFFQELEENDILFIDSSHVVKIDGDVPYLFLEILPSLKPGVVIHIHDVPFPYNIPYPPKFWVFQRAWPKFWNESMLLQAYLCFNEKIEILLSTPLLRFYNEEFLKNVFPTYQTINQNPNTFSSIWLRVAKSK